MKTISAWLHRCSSVTAIIIATVAYGLFLAYVMIPESETVVAYAGDWGSPDGHVFYTPDTLYAELATWGAAGRDHYVAFRLGLDPVWAFVYTAFLVTITSVALRRAFPPSDRRWQLNVVALLPLLADLTENALGMILVSNYPLRMDTLAWVTASVSGFKWVTLAVAHMIMLYAAGAAVMCWIGERRA